jgi:hypothetical protein
MFLGHVHTYTPDEDACDECGGHVYEVKVNGRWCKTSAYIFRSWTGPRRLDGKDYNGPIFILGSEEVHSNA